MKKTGRAALSAILCAALMSGFSAAAEAKSVYNMKAPEKKSDSFVLTWDAQEGADAYRIYKYDTVAGKYVVYKTVVNEQCTFSSLEPETAYKVKVRSLYKENGKYKKLSESGAVTVKTKKEATWVNVNSPEKNDSSYNDGDALSADEKEKLKREYNTASSERKRLESSIASLETKIKSTQSQIDKKNGSSDPKLAEELFKLRQQLEQYKEEYDTAKRNLSTAAALENSLKTKLRINGVYVT